MLTIAGGILLAGGVLIALPYAIGAIILTVGILLKLLLAGLKWLGK